MLPQGMISRIGMLAASDPVDHVVAHPIAPIFPDWNITLPIIGGIKEFWFTNHLLMSLVAAVLTLLIFIPIGRRYQAAMAGTPIDQSVPRGFASLVEGFMDALRNSVARPVLGQNTDRFMPFLWTVFFFILICNLLGMVPFDPIFSLMGFKHIGGTATGNLSITGGLALCAFFMFHFSGIREIFQNLVAGTHGHHHHDEDEGHGHDGHHGHGHDAQPMASPLAFLFAPFVYMWNFAPHAFQVEGRRGTPGAGLRLFLIILFTPFVGGEFWFIGYAFFGVEAASVMFWVGAVLGLAYGLNVSGFHPVDLLDALMWGFLFLLEVIGALVKPFALCMRLFANMVAGHIVLASLLLLIPVFKGLTVAYFASSIPVALGCVGISCLELFVAFLQAYIFMFLCTLFIDAAVNPEH